MIKRLEVVLVFVMDETVAIISRRSRPGFGVNRSLSESANN